MTRRVRWSAVTVALAASVSACASGSASGNVSSQLRPSSGNHPGLAVTQARDTTTPNHCDARPGLIITLSRDRAKRFMCLPRHYRLEVDLKQSDGFRWVGIQSGDPSVLRVVSHTANSGSGPVVVQVITRHAGRTQLQAVSDRFGDTYGAPDQVVRLTVRVSD